MDSKGSEPDHRCDDRWRSPWPSALGECRVQTRPLRGARSALRRARNRRGVRARGCRRRSSSSRRRICSHEARPHSEGWLDTHIAGWGRCCGDFRETRGMPLQGQGVRARLDVDGPRRSASHVLATVGVRRSDRRAHHGPGGHCHDTVLRSHDGRTTAAHPVVAGGRGGADSPAPVLRWPSLRGMTRSLNEPKVRDSCRTLLAAARREALLARAASRQGASKRVLCLVERAWRREETGRGRSRLSTVEPDCPARRRGRATCGNDLRPCPSRVRPVRCHREPPALHQVLSRTGAGRQLEALGAVRSRGASDRLAPAPARPCRRTSGSNTGSASSGWNADSPSSGRRSSY